jgi:hypothetical protein
MQTFAIPNVCVCMQYMYACVFLNVGDADIRHTECVRMHVCIYVCVCVFLNVGDADIRHTECVCMYVYMYVCVCVSKRRHPPC